MKFLQHIPAWLSNKFLIAATAFAIIMLFMDKNDVFTQANRQQQLKELQQSKQFYTLQINTERAELDKMRSNPGTLEKYARENYLMKKDNEDLFIVNEP